MRRMQPDALGMSYCLGGPKGTASRTDESLGFGDAGDRKALSVPGGVDESTAVLP